MWPAAASSLLAGSRSAACIHGLVEWCREVGDSFQAVPRFQDADDLITLKGIQVNAVTATTPKNQLEAGEQGLLDLRHMPVFQTGINAMCKACQHCYAQ